MECRHVLKRLSFSADTAKAIVRDCSNDFAKDKISHLKANDIDILVKMLCLECKECGDNTRDARISITYLAQ